MREINVDHIGGSAGGNSQVSTFWKGVAEFLNHLKMANSETNIIKRKAIKVNLNSQINQQQVRPQIDSFISTDQSFYFTNESMNSFQRGFIVDGSDTSGIRMFPDSTFFAFDTYFDMGWPTNVVKINKNQ